MPINIQDYEPMHVALIGYSGYWGSKLARVAKKLGWNVEEYNRKNIDLLPESDATAAIIATPPDTHFGLIKQCLSLGMDVFIEKPMCMSSAQVNEVDRIAKKMNAVVFVDSIFLYTESFHALWRQQENIIGYQSQRLSPPLESACINAGWDMIWHDLAILDVLGALEVGGIGVVDGSIATAALPLSTGGSAFIMASRCWPSKVREIVIHVPAKTYVWNLAGLRKMKSNEYLAKESLEALECALTQFEICCKDRKLEHLTDCKHALRVTIALEHLFPRTVEHDSCFQSKKSLAN